MLTVTSEGPNSPVSEPGDTQLCHIAIRNRAFQVRPIDVHPLHVCPAEMNGVLLYW